MALPFSSAHRPYFARSSPVPLQLNAVRPEQDPPYPFVFDMSMAVARSNRALRDELNGVIAASQPSIDAILRDYAVPVKAPHKVAAR